MSSNYLIVVGVDGSEGGRRALRGRDSGAVAWAPSLRADQSAIDSRRRAHRQPAVRPGT